MLTVSGFGSITALNDTHLPCSGSEGRILRLAASLAHAILVDLQDALTGLDDHNTALTLAADAEQPRRLRQVIRPVCAT